MVAQAFYEKIASPVLTDVRLDVDGLDLIDVHPRELGDVWAERPLVIHARYRTPGRGRVVLRGFRQGAPYEQTLEVALPETEPAHEALESMWARARVEALTTEDPSALQTGTFPEALREEIVRVALAHRIVTAFTSFVAVEDRIVNEGGVTRTMAVPVEMPQGVTYEGVFGEAKENATNAPASVPALAMAKSAASVGAGVARDEMRGAPRERDAERMPLRLDSATRQRLAADLLVLLEQGPGAPGAAPSKGGWVHVRIVPVAGGGRGLRARVEALGAYVTRAGDKAIEVTIAVESLPALAGTEGVERLESMR
jgi:hypothetical protein